jgi:hypothetical protein
VVVALVVQIIHRLLGLLVAQGVVAQVVKVV